MKLAGLAISMGLGAAAGAVGILMLSGSCPTRKLAAKAAEKAENAANTLRSKLTNEIDSL